MLLWPRWWLKPISAVLAPAAGKQLSGFVSAVATCLSWRAAAPISTLWCACMVTCGPRCRQRKATSKPLCSSCTAPKIRWRRKADRDTLEAEMDGAGDFGGRLHSFSEEETMTKGIAEFDASAAHQTYRMLDD